MDLAFFKSCLKLPQVLQYLPGHGVITIGLCFRGLINTVIGGFVVGFFYLGELVCSSHRLDLGGGG